MVMNFLKCEFLSSSFRLRFRAEFSKSSVEQACRRFWGAQWVSVMRRDRVRGRRRGETLEGQWQDPFGVMRREVLGREDEEREREMRRRGNGKSCFFSFCTSSLSSLSFKFCCSNSCFSLIWKDEAMADRVSDK